MLAVTMVPRQSEMNMVSSEAPKLSRGEMDLRKCLTSATDEILLKSYACAWQKEILVQGRLYITSHHFCFYSSILGWETKTVIKVSDITCIKKDKTAHLFPNAIMISTADKKYGFSTFAHRNKSFNILQLVWQNNISKRPISQEILAARIKLLKIKSKSVESSPVSTPQHGRHPIWQLSVRGSSKTDSDSSGNNSPILLSRPVTPTPSSSPPARTAGTSPSHPHHNSTVCTEIPHVTVTATDSVTGIEAASVVSHNSSDTPFADATDGKSEDNSILKSGKNVSGSNSNLNTDSVSTSDSTHQEIMGSSNSSDTESNSELHTSRKRMLFTRKSRSSSVSGGPLLGQSEEDVGITFKTSSGDADPLRGSTEAAASVTRRTSFLSQILSNVDMHPTRIGIWRLQKAFSDWCTPSNFINLLILISIFLLLISTASMVCKLSYVNPSLQPLLAWQPWCKLCSDYRSTKLPPSNGAVSGDYTHEGEEGRRESRGGVWTVEVFEELVKKHANDPDTSDDISNT